MNYRKIELIFLVAFLCINIYLISVWQDNNAEQVDSSTLQQRDVIALLKEDKIKYPEKISNKHLEGSYISGKSSNLLTDSSNLTNQTITENQGTLVSSFTEPINVSKKDELLTLDNIKNNSKIVQYGKEYSYLKEASQSDKVVCYSQVWEGLPIFDETAEIVFIKEGNNKEQKDKITGYKQQYLEDLKAMRDKQVLISQKEALLTLYQNSKLSKGVKINWMTLGYSKIYNENKLNVYVPTWIVGIESANGVVQIEKVNAITNRIMSNSSTDKVN